MKPNPGRIEILGIPVDHITLDSSLARIAAMVEEPVLHQIATVNPEFVMAARQDPAFADALRRADLCLPDGIGLIWASRRLGRPLPERVPGSEMVYHLAAACAAGGWPLFLLGAAPGVAAEAAGILQRRYPTLIIAGTYAGSPAPAEDDHLTGLITASSAQVLYVAYGAPQQDLWIDRNRKRLPGVRIAIGVGGSLDFITGRAVRAPRWMQRIGLEWLHRLLKEPWRWRRMLALPRFAAAVWRESRGRS